MSNLTDKKPVACGGWVMRRTDSHIINNSKPVITKSGDEQLAPPIRNFALTTVQDSDPRWGKGICDFEDVDESEGTLGAYTGEYKEEFS